MYPQGNLDRLARRKRALLIDIRARREDCAAQVQQVLQPVVWAEGIYARWKAISPALKIAAVPVGVMLKRKLFPGGGILGKALRWAPVAISLFKSQR